MTASVPRIPLGRAAASLLAIGALTVGLAGCVNNAEPAPTQTTADAAVTEITDQPGTTDGYVGARDDVEIEACEKDGESWVARGTVVNPTDAAQDYRIYVSWLDGSDTRGLVQVDVDAVAAGASGEWSASAALPDDDLECVLRVERFADDGAEG